MKYIIQIANNSMFDSQSYSQIKHERSVHEPSLNGGYTALYDNRIPIDIRYVDYDRNVKHIGGAEFVSLQLFTFGNKGNTTKIKLEVDSQYDPFFNLIFECDSSKYGYLKKQQSLNSDFQEFPTLLIKCFNKIEEQSHRKIEGSYKGKLNANLLVASDGKAKLEILQSSDYKNIQVVALDLSPENEENLQQKVSQRYGELKKKVQQTEERLAKIQELIRIKNPTLLTQIYKTSGPTSNSKLNISQI